uniref:Phostensin/Taperin PP1-binding domain-containing protein n=1 Tax=Oryzias melastigma TaxID=30732 RepID=A0A3B3DAE1_ORYME
MSVSSLPEWKQLLLEKKRREEVERGRREKEEEEKLASMPAWKRGIIQRRRAKQETPKAASQVSVETIVPVHENPFMRTQSSWTGRKGKDGEPGNELEVKERDKMSPRGQDAETRRRFKDLNEGWERERSREGCEKDKKEQDFLRTLLKSIPKRSFSFSDRVIGAADGRMNPEDVAWKDKSSKLKLGCARLLQRDRFGKPRDEKEEDADEGFTLASVKSTEGISFAKRVPIRQDGKTRADREQPAPARSLEKEVASSAEGAETDSRQDSAFTETSGPSFPPRPQNKQTITIAPSFLRNQSSENSLKPANCAPTPASSPSSPSPTQSPCASPSPTPSPVLFSIKSASGGHVKRGATITVTPKKASTGGGAATRPTAPQQTNLAAADPARKKYPTVEEIEVIGGYQNLERSCLIKSRGTPKRVSSTLLLETASLFPRPNSLLSVASDKLPFVFVCFCMPAGVCSGC